MTMKNNIGKYKEEQFFYLGLSLLAQDYDYTDKFLVFYIDCLSVASIIAL